MSVSPLGALVSLVILAVTVELVERKSQPAAFGLAVVLLLGMITFNAIEFRQQLSVLIGLLNAKPVRRGSPTAVPKR